MAMENIEIYITEVKTKNLPSNYSSTKEKEDGTKIKSMDYNINFKAEYKNEIVYFQHNFKYKLHIKDNIEQLVPDKEETDFAKIIDGVLRPKVFPERTIRVRCQIHYKVSDKGNKYINLKRVRLLKADEKLTEIKEERLDESGFLESLKVA